MSYGASEYGSNLTGYMYMSLDVADVATSVLFESEKSP